MYREAFGKDNVIVVDFDGAAERGISPAGFFFFFSFLSLFVCLFVCFLFLIYFG